MTLALHKLLSRVVLNKNLSVCLNSILRPIIHSNKLANAVRFAFGMSCGCQILHAFHPQYVSKKYPWYHSEFFLSVVSFRVFFLFPFYLRFRYFLRTLYIVFSITYFIFYSRLIFICEEIVQDSLTHKKICTTVQFSTIFFISKERFMFLST